MKSYRRYSASLCAALLLVVVGFAGTGLAQAPADGSALEREVDEALGTVQRRYLTAGVHSPWQIMHGVLALGYDMRIREGADDELVGAIDYICRRATVGGRRILEPTAHGLRFLEGYEMQGHTDQFLAILAQADVPADAPIEIGEQRFTVADLVKNAQAEAGQHAETSWTIVALSHYLGPEAEWRNQYDQRYTIEGLVRYELERSVESGACGGTHRLGALSIALADYRRTGKSLDGVWQRAYEQARRYLDRAQSYQFSDGAFSSDFFEGSSRTSDIEDHLHAHGHTLEWVVTAVEPEELEAPWVTRAVEHLCETLRANSRRPLDCGSLYHAGSALRVYRQRRWGTPAASGELAETRGSDSAAQATATKE